MPTKEYYKPYIGSNGITFIKNAKGQWYVAPDNYGGASGFNKGKITSALIYISPYNSANDWKIYNKGRVIRHEMGHVLGLGHTGENSTIHSLMSNNNDLYYRSKTLTTHDKNDLRKFYQN